MAQPETPSVGGAIPEISAVEAIDLVENGMPLVDVREHDEWAAGHSPHAFLIPLSELDSRLGELPRDMPILLVCRSGMRSSRAAEHLAGLGFLASNLTGGMLAWRAAGGELESESGADPRV